ncbi:MAG: hypothetical protein NZM06_07445 [Chloroherpetonaceae bacterium]|nr:hypothetical protein [Chloroherpetonaceae bacterium]
MPTLAHRLAFLAVASLFLASTVCGILDDRSIDRSYLNLTDYHACFATNCPICGAQYQAQNQTSSLQNSIVLASDEMLATLTLADETASQTLNFSSENVSPDSSPPKKPLSTLAALPLRI